MNLELSHLVYDSLADEVHISFALGTKRFAIEIDTARETVVLKVEDVEQ